MHSRQISASDPSLWLACIAPLAICWLVQVEGTRRYRSVLWVISAVSMIVSLLFVDMDGESLPFLLVYFTLGAGLRYAFMPDPPMIHRPIRPPLVSYLRDLKPFIAFELLVNPRLIGVDCNPRVSLGDFTPHPATLQPSVDAVDPSDETANPTNQVSEPPDSPCPATPSKRSYPTHLANHLLQGSVHFLCSNLPYPAFLLILSQPAGREFEAFQSQMARRGVPTPLVVPLLGVVLAWSTYHGLCLTWHCLAILGIGSGIWTGEEWPKIEYAPWMSSSQIELWGKRFHQLLRPSQDFITAPLKPYIAHYLFPLIPFLYTAFFHSLAYLPITHHFPLSFFYAFAFAALGCMLEWAFYKYTCRKVSGWSGRAWTWCWILGLVTRPLVLGWWDDGMEGIIRGQMEAGLEGNVIRLGLEGMGWEEAFEAWLLG